MSNVNVNAAFSLKFSSRFNVHIHLHIHEKFMTPNSTDRDRHGFNLAGLVSGELRASARVSGYSK